MTIVLVGWPFNNLVQAWRKEAAKFRFSSEPPSPLLRTAFPPQPGLALPYCFSALTKFSVLSNLSAHHYEIFGDDDDDVRSTKSFGFLSGQRP